MFCVLALIIFSILGIFSASHRQLAKEAFDCVFRRVTLRPCNTGFDRKIKGKIIGKLLNRSESVAKFLNKNFELVSWIFFILLIVSSFWVVRGGYNFYMYGSCNGLNSSGFCALDPKGENNKVSQGSTSCGASSGDERKVTLSGVNLDLFPTKDSSSENTVVLIGCFGCQYTRKAYPLIKRLIEENSVKFIFAHYPVKDETTDLLNLEYCAYQQSPEKYWQLFDKLFSLEQASLSDKQAIKKLLSEVGFDIEKINNCEMSPETLVEVAERRIQLEKTNIYGTPLVFVNGSGLVGPKPYRIYKRMLK
jgi:protein-disulfide isomerase